MNACPKTYTRCAPFPKSTDVAFCKKMQTVNCDYLHTIQTPIMALLRK